VVATLAVRRWSQSLSEVIEQVGELAALAERGATFVFSMAKRAGADRNAHPRPGVSFS
jgi:hypothetical protein